MILSTAYLSVLSLDCSLNSIYIASVMNKTLGSYKKSNATLYYSKTDEKINRIMKNKGYEHINGKCVDRRFIKTKSRLKTEKLVFPVDAFECVFVDGTPCLMLKDYQFEAKESPLREALDISNSAAVFVIDEKALSKSCPHFNPCVCDPHMAKNCKYKKTDNCLNNNIYTVKKSIENLKAVSKSCLEEFPYTIAIAGGKSYVAYELINTILDDIYSEHEYRPNVYFVDPIGAINGNKKSASLISLPVADVILSLITRGRMVCYRNMIEKFFYGSAYGIERDLKEVLLNILELGEN